MLSRYALPRSVRSATCEAALRRGPRRAALKLRAGRSLALPSLLRRRDCGVGGWQAGPAQMELILERRSLPRKGSRGLVGGRAARRM